ncbi:receptor-like protein 33 [Cryptomeria japonica]|uniref:receptor-like protein 33 n=1 Tax=Cryptomeria japonica TaxID=3369 RepID=UPI0025AD050A|nr:receptor-like protein 33 [Cryptomeria japonica]
MAVAPVKFTTIPVFLIIFFTNPFVCRCRCPLQESEALLSLNFTFLPPSLENQTVFYAGSDGTSGTYETTPWINGTDCCEWHGITCNQNKSHVETIDLELSDNGIIGGVISDSLCKLLFLREISMRTIDTTGNLPSCLGDLHYLQSLRIDESRLSGIIPLSICTLTNLTDLFLGGNQLSGNLPFCLNNLSSLTFLDLSKYRLSGQIPFTWGNLPLLYSLDISFNQLSGTLPLSFSGLSSLAILFAHGNRFNESTPYWALPSSIESLYLSLNHEVTVSETFFHNLTNLQVFSLSNCTLNISTSWIPNFQLAMLELVSCQMGGQIPPWISTQFELQSLTLANNVLVGEIPSWLWDTAASLFKLNLSRNHLNGPIFPNGRNSEMLVLDVSSNALSGCIPIAWTTIRSPYELSGATDNWGSRLPPDSREDWPGPPLTFMLNDNLFTGNIPPSLCNLSVPVRMLNLQKNKLDGTIPWCLIQDGSIFYDINLGGNSLEGRIPEGLIVSSGIRSLVLKNNQLSGTFLPSFANDTALKVLDIGHNKFTGHLPKSIGNISNLQVLVMKDNQFSGNILSKIGDLKQLQILDLSSNNLSGSIPHSIVFIRAMAVVAEDGYVLHSEPASRGNFTIQNSSLGGLDMNPKGTELYYPYILSTLTTIDLSNNQLNGDVPLDFGKLKGLMFLNLSMNNLSGIIPPSLGDMSVHLHVINLH